MATHHHARAPTSRSCATRASASRTSTARRAPGRCSAPATPPPRTACSSSTSCATLGRARAVVLRRRRAREPGHGRRAVVDRALHRGRLPAPVRPRRRPLRRRGRQLAGRRANYIAGINQYIAEAQLDPTKMPGEYAAHRPPAGPDDWKATDLVATASLVGGIFGKGGGERAGRGPAARRVQGTLRRQEGPHAVGALRGLRRPRRADHGARASASPTRRTPKKRAQGAEGRPTRARSRRSRCRLVDGAARDRRPAARGQPAAAASPSCRGAIAARRPSLPATPSLPGGLLPELGPLPKAMSNALLVSARQVGQRPPARGLRPAGRLLRPADPHGGGRPRRRASTRSGAAFPGVNLYVQLGRGRDYAWSATSAGQDIIDTFAVPLCDATHYRFRGAVPADRGARAQERLDAEPGRLRRRRARRRCAPSGPSSGSSPAAAPTRASRCSSRAALDLLPRGRLGRRLHAFNDPGTISGAAGLPARGQRHRLHVQLVLHRRQAHRLLQLGQQPGAREGHRPPTSRWPRRSEWRGFDPDLNTRATRRSRSTRRSSTSRPHELEQQAGPGLRAAPTRTCSARSTARSCSIDQLAPRLKGGAQDRRCPSWSTRWSRRARPTCAARRPAARAARHRHGPKDPALRRAVDQLQRMAARRRAPHRPQPRRRLRARRRDPDHGRVVAAVVRREFQPALGTRRCSRRSRPPTRSTTRPTTTATTSARPTRRASTATSSRTCASCRRTVKQKYAVASAGAASCAAAARRSGVAAERHRRAATDTYPADEVCKARRPGRASTTCASAPSAASPSR